jgi:uncharacterized membrane protein HdeD (DUF308 family)
MSRKILYIAIMVTGIIVTLVGIISFFSNYGNTSMLGIWNQITGIICVIGGLVNLLVANKVKKDINHRMESKP